MEYSRLPKDKITVELFLDEDLADRDIWVATIQGDGLDLVTQGVGPIQALESALSCLSLATDSCKPPHGVGDHCYCRAEDHDSHWVDGDAVKGHVCCRCETWRRDDEQ